MKIFRLIQITLRDALGTWSAVIALAAAYWLIYFVDLGPVYFVWPEPSGQIRANYDVPPEPVGEPTPPPLLSGFEMPSDVYLARVEALLPSLPENFPPSQAESMDWHAFDTEQAAARAWCVDLVSVREGVSRSDAAALLVRAETDGELASGWVFLDALENIDNNASALEHRRREQCAGLLYMHYSPIDGG